MLQYSFWQIHLLDTRYNTIIKNEILLQRENSNFSTLIIGEGKMNYLKKSEDLSKTGIETVQ